MSSLPAYRTLARAGLFETVIKKSRFIGQCAPAANEEDALAFVRAAREAHKAASHHCYAYILGANAGLMRYQDDGEPQGTAGIPILEVMKKNRLVYCAAVVTRYFGGVLLGAGGLTRAYSAAAAGAVQSAGIVMAEPSARLSLALAYPYWDAAERALSKLPVTAVEKAFAENVRVSLIVRLSDLDSVLESLTSLTDGRAAIDVSEAFHHLWPQADVPG